PDLISFGFAGTPGSEREIFPVGRPFRPDFRFLAFGDLHVARTVGADHPDMGSVLVSFGVNGAHRVSDPFAFGRALRVANVAHASEVVQIDGTARLGITWRAQNQRE